MKNRSASTNRNSRRILPAACIMALAGAFTVGPARPARAERVTPPSAPAEIRVPAGNKPFLKGHAMGTQDYICLPSGTGFVWTFFAPQATLSDDHLKQVTTHFLSPNPFEGGTARATWQHSRDTSSVWAVAIATSSDPSYVRPDAIPWLLLQKAGSHDGPTNGDTLTVTTFIQRLNTTGGIAPSTGCAVSSDVGKKALVPYAADYFFYEHSDHRSDDD